MAPTRINLTGGGYNLTAFSASAQRCLNLYPEPLPQTASEPVTFVHYPTPGLQAVYNPLGTDLPVRCLYTTSQGQLLAVIGSTVYYMNANNNLSYVGVIGDGTGQVRMQDNGLTCFVVDGSSNGWYFSLPTSAGGSYGDISGISTATDSAFYGSQTISILDQFFLFTDPNSRHWYCSTSDFTDDTTTPFNSLYIASKTSYPDQVVGIATVSQTIWIFGKQTTELWCDSGAADFPFQRINSILTEQGCESAYSIATAGDSILWLARDLSGHARVFLGKSNQAEEVSNFAVCEALNSYGDMSDAIGNTYQQDGHVFYVLTLPTAGKTWVFDITTNQWHERCSLDSNGDESRYRANCWASAYGNVYCGDYENGKIYKVLQSYPDEDGNPIKRQRGFPHMLTNGTRAIHRSFCIDAQNGSGMPIQLDWSDDRGATYGTSVPLPLGNTGNTWPTVWRLGMARDRVYRLTWTDKTYQTTPALFGAFLNIQPVRN